MKPPIEPTGHLARLLERVTPIEPMLQRRQPALFEQTGPHAAAGPQESVSELEPTPNAGRSDEAALLARAARSRVPAEPAAAPSRSARDVAADATLPHGSPQRITRSIEFVREPAPTAKPIAVDATVRVPPTPTPQVAQPVPSPASARVPGRAAERADATGSTGTSRRVGPIETPVTEIAATRPARRHAATHAEPPAAPRRARQAEVTAPPVVQPAVRPAARSRAALRAAAHATNPVALPPARELPPVEITIGRVEVRAVAAPQGAARKPAGAPRLSLDQYLRERAGGGR